MSRQNGEIVRDNNAIEWLLKEDVVPAVKKAAQEVKKLPGVVRVGYFGSFVRNDQVPGSDIDILIELKQDDRRWIDRMDDFRDYFKEVPCPVEIFAFTTRELADKDNKFYQEILRELVEV
jgi:predicted nucleotidyltransferase